MSNSNRKMRREIRKKDVYEGERQQKILEALESIQQKQDIILQKLEQSNTEIKETKAELQELKGDIALVEEGTRVVIANMLLNEIDLPQENELKVKNEESENKKRVICKADFVYASHNDTMQSLEDYFKTKIVCKLQYMRVDGSIVKRNDIIACSESKQWVTKANADGRIFYINSPMETISNNDDLAVICDVDDTKDKAMKWYQRVSKGKGI